MAETKKKTIVAASDGKETETTKASNKKAAKPVGNATGLRIGAAVLWAAAIGMEVLAILILFPNVFIDIPAFLFPAVF